MHTPPTEPSLSTEFTMFMRAYQDMVFSTAARLSGNDALAEDVAQEVFVRAYQNFQHLRSSTTAGGWLKTVATNLMLNHLTRYRRRWRFFSEFKPPAESESDSTDGVDFPVPDTLMADLDSEQRRAVIDTALRRLPDHQRLPLVLYHFHELSYDDIAARLRVSLAKVKTDIRRARAALLPMLTSAGITRDNLEN